jgi:uncharacterized membrane protein
MFCPNCGANVQGRFCAKCGTAVDAATASTGPAPGAEPYTAGSGASSGGLTQNVAGALCYPVGFITGILFLLLEPHNKNKFVRFHAFQSIFLSVAAFILSIVMNMFLVIMPGALWALWGMIAFLVQLAILGLVIFLIVKAYNNERFKLPIIGDLAEKQA